MWAKLSFFFSLGVRWSLAGQRLYSYVNYPQRDQNFLASKQFELFAVAFMPLRLRDLRSHMDSCSKVHLFGVASVEDLRTPRSQKTRST